MLWIHCVVALLSLQMICAEAVLPLATVFRGATKFDELVLQAQNEHWRQLPLDQRMRRVALALKGTPYQSYTLEIDDRIEAPSADLDGVDCWTFFELTLGLARMLAVKDSEYQPQDLLKMIEMDRYRNGHCEGYLSRLHFLEQWSIDNEGRGLVHDMTRELGGIPVGRRTIREMTDMYKSYRYLRADPSLLPQMASIQREVSDLPVYYIPKRSVADIEPKLQTGDIICIVTADPNAYTSHVGLAYRDEWGLLHFMHATSSYDKGRRVIIDGRLSNYLAESASRIGIMAVRPLEVPQKSLE